MKVSKSLVLACVAGGVGVAGSATAQQVIYDNSVAAPTFYSGIVPAGAANGHERGDEVNFAGNSRELNEIMIMIYSQTGAGSAGVQVRIYDDPGTGNEPGPILWDSGVMPNTPHNAGTTMMVVPIPNVQVPGDTVIWTVHLTNRTGSTGDIGLLTVDPPAAGTSGDWFWAYDAPNFPGWNTLWFGGNPVANFGAKITATGTVLTGACCLPDATCMVTDRGDCLSQDGLYQGDNTECATVVCRDPGACCLPDGTCFVTAEHVCVDSGGTYHGDLSTCATVTCPQPGACCFADGSCVIASSSQCSTAGGTYNGDQSLCGPVSCSQPPVLLKNGPLATGEMSSLFVQAPQGTQWSELQDDALCSSTLFGLGITGANRMADNFIVPGTEGWNIDTIEVFAYQTQPTNAPSTPPPTPFLTGTVRIWDGPPSDPASTVVWGDTTTNRLAASDFANLYRISRTATTASQFQRPIFRNELTIGTHLDPGHYWVDVSLTVASGAGFTPPVTIIGSRSPDGANALQQTAAGGPWAHPVDAGAANCPPVRQELAFIVYGEEGPGGACYANCDGSTTPPILNVDDFTCFINAFASAQPLPHAQQVPHYANCDGSTTAPVLNVDDFTCFINEFAAGCN